VKGNQSFSTINKAYYERKWGWNNWFKENIRGSKKAIRRLIELIGEQGEKLEEKILGIAHCNCLEKALSFKEEVLKRYKFKDIIIVETGGISTVYANDGGIIIAF